VATLRYSLLLALFCGGLLSFSDAGEDKKPAKGGKTKVIQAKEPTKVKLATTIAFSKELGVGFPSLISLGARIESAREKADPVGLAAAAVELAAAEKASSKHAGITSNELTKEAIALARIRSNPQELRAVAHLVGESGGAKDLLARAHKAAASEEEHMKKRKSGEATRGITRYLYVDSRLTSSLNVYVDGQYVGTVPPYGDRRYNIFQTAGETTYLRARASDGREWADPISGAYLDFTWVVGP